MMIGPKPLISRKKGREGYAAGPVGVNTTLLIDERNG
jgi:hypothetical protein